MNNKVKVFNVLLFVFMILETVIMFPCFVRTITGSGNWNAAANTLKYFLAVPMLLFILMQCFYVPEILFVLNLVFGIIILVINKRQECLSKKLIVMFCIFLIVSITGFFSAKELFWSAMSV